ncbi:protein MAIN-LIKE 2-like [Vicia villosa]|uniref:protein MAIN-LIKE 2-like n=1 Tax=Vicia villosa TaxID=3911 RepID=UPI00273AB5FB|nr:protein MAIN-LIKE 2-like [Vicia villosa]
MALLERWRPESHTFHFPTSECTITLEDVSMLLGLRVNGNAVAGPTELDLDMWEEFLGAHPPRTALKGRMVLISWLKSLLANNPVNENSTVGHLTTYTRIFNLLLIGLSLMPDKRSKYVHIMWVPLLQDLERCNTYSWGSAVLAYLYREMCKSVDVEVEGMGGCVELIQAWGYSRLPFLAPISPELPSYPYAARWGAKKKKTKDSPQHCLLGYRISYEYLMQNPQLTRGKIAAIGGVQSGTMMNSGGTCAEHSDWTVKKIISLSRRRRFVFAGQKSPSVLIGHQR